MNAGSVLPTSWAECQLGDVLDYGSTDKAEPSEISDDDWILELEDIERDTSRLLHRATFRGRQSKSTKNRFQVGDVLYGKLRPYLNKVVQADADGFCTTEIIPLRPPPEVNARYLFHWLRHPRFTDYVTAVSHGLNMPRLGTEAGRRAPFVLAPIKEQKRVADKLDTLLARVVTCRERLDRVPAILKRFRQTVLSSATSGSLTSEWRLAQGRSDAWEGRLLRDLGELGRGKSKHRPRNDGRLFGGPYPFIQTGAVAQSSGLITEHVQTYSEFGLAQSRLWPAGTLCITIAANIADTAILTYPACFPDSVVGFIPNQAYCVAPFVKWSIDVVRDQLEAFAPATAQKNINLDVLRNVHIKTPPLDEQAEIVRRVESLFAHASSLEARLAAARVQIDRLTPTLLSKAFRGELVEQDADDAPASVLLSRLRRQSEVGATGNAKRGARGPRTHAKAPTAMLTRKDVTATHLTSILKERGALTAEVLWTASNLEIDEFYEQLKDEEAGGFLRENRGNAPDGPRLLEPAA